jgi:hypothetical protein
MTSADALGYSETSEKRSIYFAMNTGRNGRQWKDEVSEM